MSFQAAMRRGLITVAIVCPLASQVRAETTVVEDACVKYEATSKVYNVEVKVVDGGDLWPRYAWSNILTKYAIVFWEQDQATVIDIGTFGLLMETGVQGTDLQGRRWKVARQPWC